MHPYLIRIPMPWGVRLTIASYGVMIMLGFLAALLFLLRRGRRWGLAPQALFDVALATLLCGIVGSRVFFVVHEWDYFSENLVEIIRIDRGGLWFYGGLMGGAAAALVVVRLRKLPATRTLDVITSVLPLGHAFGRMGCFLNGCCFGRITASWVGVRFPRILDGGDIVGSEPFVKQLSDGLITPAARWSLPVHATQLYEVGYNLLIFLALSACLPRRWRDGEVAWLYGILYGSARFINEILRADQGAVALGLTLNQWLCLGLVVFAFAMFLRGRSLGPQPLPEPFLATEEADG